MTEVIPRAGTGTSSGTSPAAEVLTLPSLDVQSDRRVFTRKHLGIIHGDLIFSTCELWHLLCGALMDGDCFFGQLVSAPVTAFLAQDQ